MARPPEDPETLESGVLFDWYVNHSLSSPFYVAGDSHVVFAPPSPAFDSGLESDGSDSARDSEDIVEVGAVGGAESGLEIDSDRLESVSESIQYAAADEVDPQCAGLRVVSIDSDSDSVSEYQESENFDSFDLESQRNLAEELEWEEVSEQAHDRDEDVTVSSENFTEEFGGAEEDDNDSVARHLEWEFLLAVNNMQRNLIWDSDPHSAAPDDFFYAAEFDILLDQFVENEIAIRGSPPAAKAAVDDLPLIILSESDVQSSGGVCAVCKDEVSVGDGVRKLPCSHYYHGDCILPWLAIRNSCPICRYELPTDDLEYERSKSRSNGGRVMWDSQVSEEFELFA
ncbi:E3 ubiquitin-protein ligase CIP8 [Rhodamnia argentea]|uniref:RING-type E3 ubiquitin transferase n=1 Tax=Rhodamnia argentea TaxID=178133 RepID=A0A8B8QNC7_9MYRT|nr:E3 ubiquitin-protein ligase CIP8 [Rhodamnia argentea]